MSERKTQDRLGRDPSGTGSREPSPSVSASGFDPSRNEPSPGLLMSMAMRYDHALCLTGYYDQLGPPGEHRRRLESALTTMRQLWEEVTGNGFYRPENEDQYVSRLQRARARDEQPKAEDPKGLSPQGASPIAESEALSPSAPLMHEALKAMDAALTEAWGAPDHVERYEYDGTVAAWKLVRSALSQAKAE